MAQAMFSPFEPHLARRFPFVLGKVSRYWRQVTYGVATLWSNVDVTTIDEDLDSLQFYLGRSKDSPIDLKITILPTLSPISPLIGILQPHYRRCRSIRVTSQLFHAFPGLVLKLLVSMCQGHYAMLQHICVEGEDVRLRPEPWAIVADAVNLTSVRLRGLGLKYCRPPLTAVTQLHMAASDHQILEYTDFSKMLQSCRSLVTLCVYDDFILKWPTDPHDTYDMPFLRYVRIFGDFSGVSQLLLSISAPDLEELTIASIVLGDLTKLRRETRNAPRFPALKSFTLAPRDDDGMLLTTVADANACFPGIKLLILPDYDGLSFAKSFITTDSWLFWPELNGLAVRDIDDQDLLYEFVQYRQRLGVPLRSLYLDSGSMSRLTRMEWLKDQLSVVEADPWQMQCEDAPFLYT
ncbi:uncharacterized protein LACBIDRAFT_325236 [Laccaria bicolor S238N-H82]|uniref:Predicted protein n=1 Tax=Laccaria bicolor (strain S238N-H82 / ATCC MYA-4686) TaxID=486041 RepID=B0D4A0_LACBS|nr:uncharacterized protein LACBIDRAFT_325236 [Laccaria bicolor S238N-H82]EDR10539.1 predicted protein [Laccaria bicolor S238N-H82]|eukprot:XP_001878989.1 predicted protein [Laccaria bicolor S238N-H82]